MNSKSDYQNELGEFADEMLNRVSGDMTAYGAGDNAVTVRLNDELLQGIDGAARFLKVSRNQFMARLLHDSFRDFDANFRDGLRAREMPEKAVEYVKLIQGEGVVNLKEVSK